MTDYGDEIKRADDILRRVRRSALFDEDGDVLKLEEARLGMLRAQIHEWCVARRDERGIQAAIRTIFELDLPVCAAKKEKFVAGALKFKKARDEARMVAAYEGAKKWEALEYDFQCLVAFRSLEHFALLWERDLADDDKIFKWSIDPNYDGGKTGVNKPFLFYFNQMVLQKKIKFISKQYPTGYGKSLTDGIAIAWLLGMNPDNDIMKVLGNPVLITTTMNTIVGIMTKPFFGQVFPKFAKWFEDGERPMNMFSLCRIREGELTLADSIKTLNLKVISKDTPIDGIRVRFLFLDDVCRSKDAGNNVQHEKDIANYWNSWWKRNYNTNDFYVVAGGTAYSIYDIISTLIRHYSGGKMKPSGRNKYTYTNLDETAVFIKIPKLDPKTDESTFPKRFPTEEARQIRARDYRMFMAMEQQQPLPPETTPFYWDNLITYDFIPDENRSPFCWASIDPVRVGGDNLAMPIFRKIGDLYYLVDCIYDQAEMERLYTLIVDKIAQHNITQLVIERNTDTSLKKVIDDMLRDRGIGYCNIIEIYTYERKVVRITNMQNTIKTQLAFPAEKLYARASMMGRFMYDIVSFSWKLSDNLHDDSIDAVTMFCETLLTGRNRMCKKIETFRR
nr:MAG TPA: Terminase [Caudoviricetes sp.]